MMITHRKKCISPHKRGRSSSRRPVRAAILSRQGMTLLELLIVIGVMVILMGLALPMMKTGLEGRQIREASRQVSTYVELAKAQAAETGRPVGLLFQTETLPEDTTGTVRFASRIYMAQTPLPYCGDIVHAKVRVTSRDTTTTPPVATLAFVNPAYNASVQSLGIGLGDLIRLDYKGPLYEIVAPTPTPVTAATPIVIAGSPLPPDLTTAAYSYQIYRQPERSSSMPLDLATGAVIDLKNSGFGIPTGTFVVPEFVEFSQSNPMNFSNASVNIVFNPSGDVAYALIDGVRYEEADTIHLLVGRLDNLIPEDPLNDPDQNLIDPDNLWVSISHQAGKVTVAENGGSEINYALDVCREFAQSAQSIGGR